MNLLLKSDLTLNIKPASIPTVNFTGKWKNDLGSTMEISVNVNGTVTGKYKTAVGQPDNFEEFDLIGYASGDLISFTANFGKYGSITSWTGQHTIKNENEVIFTMWHMAVNVEDADENKKLWGSVWSGYNNFERAL